MRLHQSGLLWNISMETHDDFILVHIFPLLSIILIAINNLIWSTFQWRYSNFIRGNCSWTSLGKWKQANDKLTAEQNMSNAQNHRPDHRSFALCLSLANIINLANTYEGVQVVGQQWSDGGHLRPDAWVCPGVHRQSPAGNRQQQISERLIRQDVLQQLLGVRVPAVGVKFDYLRGCFFVVVQVEREGKTKRKDQYGKTLNRAKYSNSICYQLGITTVQSSKTIARHVGVQFKFANRLTNGSLSLKFQINYNQRPTKPTPSQTLVETI